MQNSIHHPNVRVYKRSQSSGRNMAPLDIEGVPSKETDHPIGKKSDDTDRSRSLVYRRSLSRSRYDNENNTEAKFRSASVCRVSDDFSKSLCSSYSSDISDKYKYYSPYLAKGRDTESSSVSPYKRYESISPKETGLSSSKDFNSRSSGDCISPTTDISGIHRRYSRFSRQEANNCNIDENRSLTDKKIRERENQCALREIKEKSRESSRDRLSQSMELEQSIDDTKKNTDTARHVRNKSLDIYYDANNHSRHASRCRETSEKSLQKDEIASNILAELQTLSAIKTKKEKSEETSSSASKEAVPEKVVKKVKKVKPKEKCLDSTSTDAATTGDTKTTVIKKVKKIVKRSETKGEEKTGGIQPESSTSKSDLEKPKKESKLKRPKSFPIKETDKITPLNAKNDIAETCTNETKVLSPRIPVESSLETYVEPKEVRLIRPKSYPASKLTPPKEIKRIISNSPEKQTSDLTAKLNQKHSSFSEDNSSSTPIATGKSNESVSPTETKPPPGKKIIKVSRKSKITSPTLVPKSTLDAETKNKDISPIIPTLKERSPEKKSKGLLYAIGQKFEKLRDSAKSKEKKIATKATTSANGIPLKVSDDSKEKVSILKKKKAKSTTECFPTESTEEKTEEKSQKTEIRRSRIDAMIRSLRERSVPRTPVLTESTLIKRAVSVEEMPGTFNKCSVNRVLGLFKRFEKDGSDRKVRSTRSTSNIERQMHKSDSPIHYRTDRPKSSGFLTKPGKNANIILISKSEAGNRFHNQANTIPKQNEILNSSELLTQAANTIICPDCNQDQQNPSVAKATEKEDPVPVSLSKDCLKDKRKTLVLDFTKLDKIDNKLVSTMRQNTSVNGNTIHNASYHDTNSNNNNFRTSSNEINRNHIFSPPNDNGTTYSSDSRSFHDDCASSSTFLSPTDEPELCFDNWSICSEDNYMLATPSPTVSRLSRTSHYSSPTHTSDANESVIDRIKRRSFYSRFNEKRPKRQSSIVGPAARDYYRESSISSTTKSKQPVERQPSPDITKEFFKPLKLSPAGSELKQPIYRSVEPSKSRRLDSLHSTSPSLLLKRYTSDNDYLLNSSRVKSGSTYNSNGANQPISYYNTYNPKRRSSYNLNGAVAGATGTNHNVDGYATVGRRSTLRSYDHRTMSLLDPIGQSATSAIGIYRRDYRTQISDVGSSSRSRSNYRSTSVTRSPTNI